VTKEALRRPEEPWEITRAPRALKLLTPLVSRMSDPVLVCNFERVGMPGARVLEVYPAVRGRSALAFGAVRLAGGSSSLTLCSLNLSRDEAQHVLDETIGHLVRL
jgi:hypothetical protein